MARNWMVPVVLMLVLSSAAFAQQEGDLEQAIRDKTAEWTELFNQGDAEGFTNLYAEDAWVRQPRGDTYDGRQAVQGWMQTAYDGGVRFENVTLDEAGSLGAEFAFGRGAWTAVSAESGETLLEGEWIMIYRMVDGEPVLYRHFSGLLPPPAQESQQ